MIEEYNPTIPSSRLESHIDMGRYWLTDICDALYKDEPFNVEHFERCMEELLALHDMQIPDGELKIRPIKYRAYGDCQAKEA